MAFEIVERDETYILNYCARHLARSNTDARHRYAGLDDSDPRLRICEAWRFPIVDMHAPSTSGEVDSIAAQRYNDVSFVWPDYADELTEVAVVGSFASLHESLPLLRVADTPWFALTLRIPRGEVHCYRFLVDGRSELDAINPQQMRLDNGVLWSRLFTMECTVPLVLERWERALLRRFTDHILPFRDAAAANFLARYYDGLPAQARSTQLPRAYRFDASVGVVNFIDKLLAKEESHHLDDYRIGLELINQVLRARNPFIEPARMPREMYTTLYEQMAANVVPGWDSSRYRDPRYLLQLLRRHTVTGAFSHPKYGGNAGAAGWAWLAETLRDEDGNTSFDWQRALEPPLGRSPEYRG